MNTGTAQNFYAVETMPPPWSVKVWVIWPYKKGIKGPFECVRHKHKKTGEEVWTTFFQGEQIDLPLRSKRPADPSRPHVGYHDLIGDRPIFWAPLKPELWQAKLPNVAFVWRDPDSVPTNFSYEKQTFSASELAEEMEADRASANRETHVSREKRQDRAAEQWWRDASRIKFGQTPDALTLRDCEGRLMRAVAMSGAGNVGDDLDIATSGALSAIAEAAGEVSHYATSDPGVRLTPCPQDGGENFLEAMRWFASLGARRRTRIVNDTRATWSLSQKQKILVWRALPIPLSFDEIGQHIAPRRRTKEKETESVSGTRAKQLFDEAIDWAWRVGAGLETTWADVEIERLRDRNRSWKRNNQGAIL